MKKLFAQLFFYSSRQLRRRYRTYFTVFLVSVVLLALVMAFLEISESFIFEAAGKNKNGWFQGVFRGVVNAE